MGILSPVNDDSFTALCPLIIIPSAGIVSPITIIIVGISSVASLAFSSIELINSIRWWQLILIILSSLFGFIGVMFGVIIMVALLVSRRSCGKPYFSPFEPFNKKAQNT